VSTRNTLIRSRRKALGVSAAGLARAVGVSAAYISQIESGARRGSVTVLDAIYAHLGICSDAVVLGVASTARNMPKTGEISVVGPASRAAIEAEAARFAHAHFARASASGRPVSVGRALEVCPAEVREADIDCDTVVSSTGPAVVLAVNYKALGQLTDADSRFTICHAIAHVLLHKDSLCAAPGKVFRDRNAPPDKQAEHLNIKDVTSVADWQANVFAAALLLPTAAVYNHLDYCRESRVACGVESVAEHFGAPYEACLARLETLLPELTSIGT